MTIKDIKNHGAVLGLEAELNTRLDMARSCYKNREWTSVYSHAVFIQELAEELRKLEPTTNAKEPISNP
jgi:hypothetical protein